MKYLTHISKAYNYTASWYDYTQGTDGISRVYLGQPSGTITFTGGEGAGGNLKVYTDTFLKDFVRLDQLKDVSGELIYPDGRVGDPNGSLFEVRNSQPILNIWGVAEGYRMLLVRI